MNTYVVWWISEVGPECRRFDGARDVLAYLCGWLKGGKLVRCTIDTWQVE